MTATANSSTEDRNEEVEQFRAENKERKKTMKTACTEFLKGGNMFKQIVKSRMPRAQMFTVDVKRR